MLHQIHLELDEIAAVGDFAQVDDGVVRCAKHPADEGDRRAEWNREMGGGLGIGHPMVSL